MFGEKIKFLSQKAKGFHEGSPQNPPVKSLSERILSALRSQTGREEEEVVTHLFQQLSVLLMKGNSALVLSRTPPIYIDGDE